METWGGGKARGENHLHRGKNNRQIIVPNTKDRLKARVVPFRALRQIWGIQKE